jgi:hypothetical protein
MPDYTCPLCCDTGIISPPKHPFANFDNSVFCSCIMGESKWKVIMRLTKMLGATLNGR